jgi:hypothetical protein
MNQNAGRFKPGQSGNPGGRPKKGFSIRDALRVMMGEEIIIPGKDGKPDTVMTKGAIIASKLFQGAAQGDLTAIKMCIDNIDGPPAQGVEISGPEGAPLSIAVSYVDPPKD